MVAVDIGGDLDGRGRRVPKLRRVSDGQGLEIGGEEGAGPAEADVGEDLGRAPEDLKEDLEEQGQPVQQ